MRDQRFPPDAILEALRQLGIDFDQEGVLPTRPVQFRSLRAPGVSGIYFIEGATLLAENFADSVLITREPIEVSGALSIIVDYPQVVFYKLMRYLLDERIGSTRGIHPTAIVHPGAEISASAWIGPYCVVGEARIDEDAHLYSHVVIFDNVILEANVVVECHSAIGGTGVAWVWDPETGDRIVQPQVGGVRIGAGCFLGTDVTVVRGSVNEDTELGANCVVAHGSKIGHGARIGQQTHFANNVSVAGNVDIGNRCFLGSGCVLRPQVRLANETVVAAGAVVIKNEERSGMILSGVPAKPRPASSRMIGVPKSINRGDTGYEK